MINKENYTGTVIEVCLDGKTANIPVYDIFDEQVPSIHLDTAFQPAIEHQITKPDIDDENPYLASCWSTCSDIVFDVAMRIAVCKHVLHKKYPMIADGKSYIRIHHRENGFAHTTLLMQNESNAINNVYKSIVSAFFQNIISPAVYFAQEAKRGAYNDIDDDAYAAKLQIAKDESRNWYGKKYASVFGLTISYGADLLLHGDNIVDLMETISL